MGDEKERRQEGKRKEEGVNIKERKQKEMLAVKIDMFCQQLLPAKEGERLRIFYKVCVR